MPSVELNIEERPQGAEVEVPYLGKLKNGETTEISEDRWERFKQYRGEGNFPENGNVVIDTVASKEEARQRAEREQQETEEDVTSTGAPEPVEHEEPPTPPPSFGVPSSQIDEEDEA